MKWHDMVLIFMGILLWSAVTFIFGYDYSSSRNKDFEKEVTELKKGWKPKRVILMTPAKSKTETGYETYSTFFIPLDKPNYMTLKLLDRPADIIAIYVE